MNGMTVAQMQSTQKGAALGSFSSLMGEPFYKIENCDSMAPFFMTIASASDVWNYVWSNGALTAGRINCDHSLFPYYTADKVLDGISCTGPFSAIKVVDGDKVYYWEPFSAGFSGVWNVTRAVYKNDTGSKVIFEEVNNDLQIAFRYGWTSSDKFGLVRPVFIENIGKNERRIEVLDGCRNILPACVTQAFQNDNSVLLDAYKKTDFDATSGMAIFSVTSIVTDKAEPNEALRANICWFSTMDGSVHLSTQTPDAFKLGQQLPADVVTKGQRPACYLYRTLTLKSDVTESWYQVFDTDKNLAGITSRAAEIADRVAFTKHLEADIADGIEKLNGYIAAADGLQHTAADMTCAHHKANVMFNIMRGGIFAGDGLLDTADVISFAHVRNTAVAELFKKAFKALPGKAPYADVKQAIAKLTNPQADRLFLEYMPLTFSRRHGDPSRPWNRFSIDLKDAKGNPKLNYQGNWRDIFQNWEALGLSFPVYYPHMTAKFLNACTADGFNPYRITREGIDWEVIDPGNPWSNIGYWGDHQIIYLEKLLEWEQAFFPEQLQTDLNRACFSSSNVPYRIKPYADILKNPRSTILFDQDLHDTIMSEISTKGTDAKLVQGTDGQPALVTMTEKLIVLLTAKMANFIPGGGIWLNTQRPEWNDANNALAGYGLSMVTLYYLRRYMMFVKTLFATKEAVDFAVTKTTADFFTSLVTLYRNNAPSELQDAHARRQFVDAAGGLFEKNRNAIYSGKSFAARSSIKGGEIIAGLDAFLTHVEDTIVRNKRSDGLYHSYNTLTITKDGMNVDYLYEMLEGQVAVLSSGFLSDSDVISLCMALRQSKLYRADQHSYILYPNRELPLFIEKNKVNAADIKAIPLAAKMLAKDDLRLVAIDAAGIGHFNDNLRNAQCMDDVFATLASEGTYSAQDLADGEKSLRSLYEKTFNHHSFTGRSGTFYAYEGLGSIYWHMVSKLLLAIQENTEKASSTAKDALTDAYYAVRAGLGYNKPVTEYGAFPADPYSHTPAEQGAKQPGMTGQVKEEIITRWGELGLRIKNGTVSIVPDLLKASEFRADSTIAFTWCGVPFVYTRAKSGDISVAITNKDGSTRSYNATLPAEIAAEIFARNGAVKSICVTIPETSLLAE